MPQRPIKPMMLRSAGPAVWSKKEPVCADKPASIRRRAPNHDGLLRGGRRYPAACAPLHKRNDNIRITTTYR
jgi:hypothetical protein